MNSSALFFLFGVGISIFFYCVYRSYEKKIDEKKEIIGSISLLLAIVGIFLTIGNDFFSQFDYKTCRILKNMIYPQEILSFNDIKSNHKSKKPFYYFALDVSGSINNQPKIKVTNNIKKKIDNINASGECTPNEWKFIENDGSMAFSRLLQVRLMNSIVNLKEKLDSNFHYSIVFFADNPSELKTHTDEFGKIYNQNFKGEKTNFIDLLGFYCKKIKNASHNDSYEPIDYYIVFFSDYVHDAKSEYDRTDIGQIVSNSLQEMHKKNISMRLYRLDGYDNYDAYAVDTIFRRVFPASSVGLLDVNDELVYPIISKRPISFFYENNLFEESLKTHFKFEGLNHKKDISIGLGANSDINGLDEMKQKYYLIVGTDTVHLTSFFHKITVDKYNDIEIMIKGYIPAPYKSPDIIMQDEEEGIRYIIPVTFYKKLSLPGYMTLGLILSLLLYVFYLVFHLLWKKYGRPNKNGDDESEG